MIKRTNKITALLLAVASLVSATPAMAAADELSEKEGQISNAIAFKDGKYIYDGYKNDSDIGVYYNDGTNERYLENINDLGDAIKYGNGYTIITNSDDEYKVNLNNGEIVSDELTREDALELTKSKLRRKLAKSDRYGRDTEVLSLKEVSGNTDKFGNNDTWYEYTATGNEDYAPTIDDDETTDDDHGEENVKTRIKVEINAFYSDITIAGKTFSPAWGNDLPATLKAAIENADFGDYTVESVESQTNDGDQNSGKVTVIFATSEELTTVPDGFMQFGGNAPTWEMSSKILDEKEAKTRIKVEINAFYSDITIAGKTFSPAWGNDLPATLKAAIENADFGDYTVESVESQTNDGDQNSGKVTVIFTTSEELATVPDGFVQFGGNIPTWEISSKILDENNDEDEEVITGIKVEVNAFYSDITIAGKTFSPAWGNDLPATLKTAIESEDFGDYKVESVESQTNDDDQNSGKVTVIFSMSGELTTIPDGFVQFGGNTPDWEISSKILSEEELNDILSGGGSGNEDDDTEDDSNKVIYYGYTDGKGNYIDCSKIANLRIFNGVESVKLKNFVDNKTTTSKNSSGETVKKKVKIGLPTVEATLGEDDNYVYSLISVPVIGSQPENGSGYKDTTEVNLKYVQKISKTKSDTKKEGGAYLPSSVESYQLNNNTGWDEGDNWAYMAAYYMIQDSINEFGDNRGIRIIDGNIYVAHSKEDDDGDDAVTFGKLKLKKASKITIVDEDREIRVPLVFEDFANETKAISWTFDSNGNVWALYRGKVKKSEQGNEFQDTYKCDRNMNNLDVYDENNIIVWDDQDPYYATAEDIRINSSKLQVTTDTKTGWYKEADETWHLYDLAGNETKGWVNYNSCWYYFNNEGVMQTGWINDGGKSYYLASSGVMKTGWIQIEDKWYYLDQLGAKQQSTTINGYALDENGVWIK